MKIIRIFLILIYIISVCGSASLHDRTINFASQWDTVRVLRNPYKGWYHHLFDNGISKYVIKNDSVFASFPGMDHIYLRLAWSYLEPKEGEFDWSYIDRVVQKYVSKGYKISFRITCSETGRYPGSVGEEVDGVQYATPSWVAKAGAMGTLVDRGEGRNKSWIPKWDDPVFLEKLNQFHQVFANRYDGKPWVSYVDLGSIGDWGEGHTNSSTKVVPTMSEVKANMDIYLKNYTKSQLVVCDDLLWYGKPKNEIQELYQYATENGMSLRDDSPMVGSYIQQYLNTWSISHPQFYDPLYLKKPIILETAHYGYVKKNGNWLGKNGETIIPDLKVSGADILRGAIKTMHASYIGYHGFAEEWLGDNPDLTRELANLCGYWYFPVKAVLPEKFSKGENKITLEWLNKGVAPSYNLFGLALRFESQKHEDSFDLFLDDSGNMNWLPGINKVENYKVRIPSKVKKGDFILKFKLLERTPENDRDIQIGLKTGSSDSLNYTEIAKIKIKE